MGKGDSKKRIGTCALCKEEKVVLEESHILPKFVSRKQKKESATGFLRNIYEPNKRIQDGDKQYLLCGKCEDLFNISETDFAKKVFLPFVEERLTKFEYGKWLIYFICSVNWRNLYLDIEEWRKEEAYPKAKLDIFEKGEQELRKYLIGEKNELPTIQTHIFFFGDIKEASGLNNSEPHTFFKHSSFGYSVQLDNGYYVVTNLLGLILVTIIRIPKQERWEYTRVYPKVGELNPAEPQHVTSKLFGELFRYMKESEQAMDLMSESQKKLLVEEIRKNPQKLLDSKLHQDRLKDKMFQRDC